MVGKIQRFYYSERNKAKNEFEKDFYNLLKNAFYGKTIENVCNRIKVEFIRKDDTKKFIKQQSKLTFNGIDKSYENYDCITFKLDEIPMDKPVYLGFSVLELSKLLMYETYYDKLQPYFGQENIQIQSNTNLNIQIQIIYVDTDAFVLGMNTKDIIKDSENLEEMFDFSNLDEKHELFSFKNKTIIGKFKNETPKNFWIDEFVCLRSKMYASNCGNDSITKLKGICQSQCKHNKFEKYKKMFGRNGISKRT